MKAAWRDRAQYKLLEYFWNEDRNRRTVCDPKAQRARF
jgi:hypothetical protein